MCQKAGGFRSISRQQFSMLGWWILMSQACPAWSGLPPKGLKAMAQISRQQSSAAVSGLQILH